MTNRCCKTLKPFFLHFQIQNRTINHTVNVNGLLIKGAISIRYNVDEYQWTSIVVSPGGEISGFSNLPSLCSESKRHPLPFESLIFLTTSINYKTFKPKIMPEKRYHHRCALRNDRLIKYYIFLWCFCWISAPISREDEKISPIKTSIRDYLMYF